MRSATSCNRRAASIQRSAPGEISPTTAAQPPAASSIAISRAAASRTSMNRHRPAPNPAAARPGGNSAGRRAGSRHQAMRPSGPAARAAQRAAMAAAAARAGAVGSAGASSCSAARLRPPERWASIAGSPSGRRVLSPGFAGSSARSSICSRRRTRRSRSAAAGKGANRFMFALCSTFVPTKSTRADATSQPIWVKRSTFSVRPEMIRISPRWITVASVA